MKKKKTVGEIFQLLDQAKTKKDRLTILKDYDCDPVRKILKLNFDDSVKFALPEGAPPYRKLDVPDNMPEYSETSLFTECRRLYLFLDGGHKTLNPIRREQLFIQLLESLHPIEAELLVKLKDKKLKCGLTRSLVDEAFPGLLPPKKVKDNVSSKKE